ncbi:MAG: metallophosphoesterase [Pseudomonadota bacterium]
MTRVVQFADIHFGAEDPEALALAAEEISRAPPDLLIVCGDVTQRGKTSEFEAARAWLGAFDLPMLVVAGNHDTPLLNVVHRVSRPFERYGEHFAPFAAPVAEGAVAAAGFNTARGWQARGNWAEGSVRLDELTAAVEALDARPVRAVVCHHPFLSPPQSPLRTATRRGETADATLAASDANILLTCHVHAPSAVVRGDGDHRYLALSAGTLSKRLRDEPPSFNILETDGDTLSATAVTATREGERRALGRWRLDDLSEAA